jgi:hypothetical protein
MTVITVTVISFTPVIRGIDFVSFYDFSIKFWNFSERMELFVFHFIGREVKYFLAWWPSWLEVGITGHNFGRGPSMDHSTKVWLQLAQWFLRRRLKCEMLTDGQTKSDGNSSHGLKAR